MAQAMQRSAAVLLTAPDGRDLPILLAKPHHAGPAQERRLLRASPWLKHDMLPTYWSPVQEVLAAALADVQATKAAG